MHFGVWSCTCVVGTSSFIHSFIHLSSVTLIRFLGSAKECTVGCTFCLLLSIMPMVLLLLLLILLLYFVIVVVNVVACCCCCCCCCACAALIALGSAPIVIEVSLRPRSQRAVLGGVGGHIPSLPSLPCSSAHRYRNTYQIHTGYGAIRRDMGNCNTVILTVNVML